MEQSVYERIGTRLYIEGETDASGIERRDELRPVQEDLAVDADVTSQPWSYR